MPSSFEVETKLQISLQISSQRVVTTGQKNQTLILLADEKFRDSRKCHGIKKKM